MVDPVTQWVLAPLHRYIFSLLKGIKQDGTFDQDAAVAYLQQMLRSEPVAYSYDLSAATDRLPVELQKHLLNSLVPNMGDH
jgi:hypothetical protein